MNEKTSSHILEAIQNWTERNIILPLLENFKFKIPFMMITNDDWIYKNRL